MDRTNRNDTVPFSPYESGGTPLPHCLDRLPLAEVSHDGHVVFVNEAGCERWGQLDGLQVPEDILQALRALEGVEPLPIPFGGLRVLSVPCEASWLLLGYADSGVWAEGAETPHQTLAEEAPVALVRMRHDGIVTYTNPAAEALTGHTRIAMLGRRYWLEALYPDDRHRFTAALRTVGKTGTACITVRLQRADETLRRVELHLRQSDVGDEVTAVILDVTERDEVEAALLQNEALYQTFLEQSPAGIFHLDREGVVTFENHRLRIITGEDAESAWIGRKLQDVRGLDRRLLPLVEAMLEEGEAFDEVDAVFRRGDGSRRHLLVHGAPIRHPARGIVGGALMVFDVTLSREREQELRVLRRYDAAETVLRNTALSLASVHAFLDEAARVVGETAEADQVFVLLPTEDADAYEEEVRWSREPERSLVPLRLEAGEWPLLEAGRTLYARTDLGTERARELLDAVGGVEAVGLPFVTEGERVGALLLVRSEDSAERWSLVERRSLGRLGSLFETLWGWMWAETRYRQVISTIEDSLFAFTFGPRGERDYSFVTRQVEALTGYTASAFTGAGSRPWQELVHEDDRAAVAEHERALREEKESRLTYRIATPDGQLRWLRESATPSRDRAGRLVVAGILSDVTEAKEAEASLLRAKQDAEAANRMKTSFLAAMSHELRTPLGAINGFAELLEEEVQMLEGVPEEVGEFAQAVRHNAKKVLRLVNDLFDYSSLQTGRLVLDRAPLPLHPLLRQAAERHRAALEAKGVALELDLAPDELLVTGDAGRLGQVVEHLLSNAVKFTEEGRVTLRTRIDGGTVAWTVEDTGIGIGADYLPEVFTPFSQEDNRLNRNYEGSGLGLALSHRIVDAMGGTISVTSEKGQGARFTVTLPRADG